MEGDFHVTEDGRQDLAAGALEQQTLRTGSLHAPDLSYCSGPPTWGWGSPLSAGLLHQLATQEPLRGCVIQAVAQLELTSSG